MTKKYIISTNYHLGCADLQFLANSLKVCADLFEVLSL